MIPNLFKCMYIRTLQVLCVIVHNILSYTFTYFSRCELIMVDNEGLGFHIKGSAPVIIYATDPGSPAARAGVVVPGSCIVEVSVCEYVCMYAFVVSTGPVAQ